MENIVVITMPDTAPIFAGPVIETPTTARQDLFDAPVTIPQHDAHYAFYWAWDDATIGATEHGMTMQIWLIQDGRVIEHATVDPEV